MAKGKIHLAKFVQRDGWAGWHFMYAPWEADCASRPERIRLSSFPKDVTCALCLGRIKARREQGDD